MNRIHKCRIVDISTETQYVEMYERMRNKQIETYNKYMEKKIMLILRTKEEKQIRIITRSEKSNNRQNIMPIDFYI